MAGRERRPFLPTDRETSELDFGKLRAVTYISRTITVLFCNSDRHVLSTKLRQRQVDDNGSVDGRARDVDGRCVDEEGRVACPLPSPLALLEPVALVDVTKNAQLWSHALDARL